MKTSKKIAINATIFNNQESGAKRRFVSIYQELLNIKNNNYYYIYMPKDCDIKKFFKLKYNNTKFIKTNFNSNSFFQRFFLGLFFWKQELKKIRPDIFETYTLPLIKSPFGKTFLTIHDIRYLKFPKFYSWFRAIFAKYILLNALMKSNMIIVVSETIKNEIKYYSSDANIKVIYNPLQFNLKNRYIKKKIKNNFILTVGIVEKRKNYLRLIYALELLIFLGIKINVIIVGKKSDDYKNLIKLINQKNLQNYVTLFQGISDEKLKKLYAQSSGFIFQSLYEGFGIPVLESIINDCNIALSDIEVFREITQNDAFYFDPTSVNSIANALISLINNEQKVKLKKLKKNKILKQFDAKKIAKQMNNLYSIN